MQTFPLDATHDHIALYQLLKLTGMCTSGGHAKQVIASGEVCVNHQTETRKACKVRAGDTVQWGKFHISVIRQKA